MPSEARAKARNLARRADYPVRCILDFRTGGAYDPTMTDLPRTYIKGGPPWLKK